MKDNHGSVKKKYHKAGEDENNDFEAREPIHSLPIAGGRKLSTLGNRLQEVLSIQISIYF